MHSLLYRGWIEREHRGPPEHVDAYVAGSDYGFAINLSTGPVWTPRASLLTTPEIADRLARVSTIRTKPATVTLAFSYPVVPGDGLEKRSLFNINYETEINPHERLLRRLVKSEGITSDAPKIVRVIPVSDYKLREEYPDTKKIKINAEPVVLHDVYFSRRMVLDHGVVGAGNVLLSPEAFEVLSPYVTDNAFFHIMTL